jgi:hypothetical protein
LGTVCLLGLGVVWLYAGEAAQPWKVHDPERPQPPVVTPATPSAQEQPGKPPSDAVVLFDGKDLSQWRGDKGEPQWKVEDGYTEIVKGKGSLTSKESFGDCQLHVEWMSPNPGSGSDQARGNSGVFFCGRYEIQILDCYQNKTYADGTTGALYGQYPPMVNACLPPGQWQMYDIIWRAPRFDADKKLTRPARVTVVFNGVVVQDAAELVGPTAHKARPPYSAHPEKGPILLQDHGQPVRFRNIWVRPLVEQEKP